MNPLRPAPVVGTGNVRGILLMVGSTVCMAVMHTSIRHVAADMHPFEITFFRCAFGFLAIVPWLVRSGIAPLYTRRFPLHALRAVVNIFGMLSFFMALSLAPLAEVTALSFLSPLGAAALAALILKERVGWRRWVAIVVGFAGALLILRPGMVQIGVGQLLVLFSVCFWSFVLIIIRVLGRTESSITVTAWMSILMAPLALIPALFHWTWPTPEQWAWLAMIGIVGNFGQIMMAQALKEGDVAVVMPIDFAKLIWIAAIAYVAFGEVPALYDWAGAAVIFGAGVFLALRERRKAAAPGDGGGGGS